MLDIKWIRENPDALDRALANAWRRARREAAKLIALDEARRAHIQKLEEAQARRNAASKEIGKAKAEKDEAAAARVMAEVAELKTFLQTAEEEGKRLDKALEDALAVVPNVPLDDVPVGPDEHANVEYRRWGEKPNRWGNAFKPKEHYELGEALGQMDFETAAKLSGSRFVVLKKGLARMERALGQFMLDLHTEEHGYTEVQPPLLVQDDVPFGTGQLPKAAQRTCFAASSDRSTNVEMTCDRRIALAGMIETDVSSNLSRSRGCHRAALDRASCQIVRPLNRIDALAHPHRRSPAHQPRPRIHPRRGRASPPLHRADPVLPLRGRRRRARIRAACSASISSTRSSWCRSPRPSSRRDEHERMLVSRRGGAEAARPPLPRHDALDRRHGFWRAEDLRHRSLAAGAGGLSRDFLLLGLRRFPGPPHAGALPAEGRVRRQAKPPRLVHTLNGSGVAVGRALIAVMENYQNEDGSITVPDALRPYMGGVERIGP